VVMVLERCYTLAGANDDDDSDDVCAVQCDDNTRILLLLIFSGLRSMHQNKKLTGWYRLFASSVPAAEAVR